MDLGQGKKRTPKKGKKNRKYGRGIRKPSHQRYNMENRSEVNKERKARKQARKEAKKNR